MPDPEIVARAHRAALTLERAWERWRIMHGLSDQPMPPVSSYVGYSIEEPWGRPRVVFGLDAREAEMMAAVLDRHECVGPFYQPDPASEHPQQPDPLPGYRYQPGPAPEHRAPAAISGQRTGGEGDAGLALRARIPAQAPSPEPGSPAGNVRATAATAADGDAAAEPGDDPAEAGEDLTVTAAAGPGDTAGTARAGQVDPEVAPAGGQVDQPDVAGRQDVSPDQDPGEPGAAESQGPDDGPHEPRSPEPGRRRPTRSRPDGPHRVRASRSPAAAPQEPAPDGLRHDGPGGVPQTVGTGGEAAGDDPHASSTQSSEGTEHGAGGSAPASEHAAPGASLPGPATEGRVAWAPSGRAGGEQPGRATERLAAWAFGGGWSEAGPGPGSYGAARTIR